MHSIGAGMPLLDRLRELSARIGAGDVGVTIIVDGRPITPPEYAVRAKIRYGADGVYETWYGPDVNSVLAQVDDKLTAQGL